jgi:butyryl-CoA dehydrogenase
MATKIEAARLLMINAAMKKDAGERTDLEAGYAKLFAAEIAMEVCTEALRVHGGYGYSKEYTVERLFRDAPFFLIGEGTSEIQKRVIAKTLLDRYKVEG